MTSNVRHIKRLVIPLALVGLALSSCKEEPSTVFNQGRLSIHSEIQRAYLSSAVDSVNLYALGVEELSRPLKPTFTWEGEKTSYEVYLSESKDYLNPLIYHVESNEVSFTNLKIDTQYFYKVMSDDRCVKEDIFTTSDEIIRNMYVSGVTNVRDLGGYPVGSGRLNQGLIYRCGRLNHNGKETVENKITDKGIHTMVNEMKIKSEIDLRLVDNNEVGGLHEGVGVLGETVKYYQCPMDYFSAMDNDFNHQSLRKVFSILGDKSNYPTVFHCSIGTDRTGYVAWLINGCLGVKEEHLWRDYLFSNFGNIGGSRSKNNIQDGYVQTIHQTRGETLQEKVTNYLLDIGIKQSQIDVIKEMMLP